MAISVIKRRNLEECFECVDPQTWLDSAQVAYLFRKDVPVQHLLTANIAIYRVIGDPKIGKKIHINFLKNNTLIPRLTCSPAGIYSFLRDGLTQETQAEAMNLIKANPGPEVVISKLDYNIKLQFSLNTWHLPINWSASQVESLFKAVFGNDYATRRPDPSYTISLAGLDAIGHGREDRMFIRPCALYNASVCDLSFELSPPPCAIMGEEIACALDLRDYEVLTKS